MKRIFGYIIVGGILGSCIVGIVYAQVERFGWRTVGGAALAVIALCIIITIGVLLIASDDK